MIRSAVRVSAPAVALLLVLLTPGVALAQSPPALPSTFRGSVTVGDAWAGPGVEVTAGHAGIVYVRMTVSVDEDGVAWYLLAVPEDNPMTPAKDGGAPGETIEFTVGGVPAHQSGTWSSGSRVTLNLSADAPTPTPTATRSATATSTPTATCTPSPTPTCTATLTATETPTATATATETATPTATETPTVTPLTTETATPTASQTPRTLLIFVPLISRGGGATLQRVSSASMLQLSLFVRR